VEALERLWLFRLGQRRLNKCGNFCGKVNGVKALILLIPSPHSYAGSP
jgi:hypothetical protein